MVFESKSSVSRLDAIEQFFLIISYLGKIIYRVGTEEGTMTFYMKECVLDIGCAPRRGIGEIEEN